MRTAVTGMLVLVGVLLPACSDSDDAPSARGAASSTSAPATSTTTTAPPTDDQGIALALTVQQSDFPPGWSQTQPPDEVEDPADRCLRVGALATATGRAESAEFAKTDTTTASSVALVFPSVDAARAAYAHAGSADMRACLDRALRADVEGGAGSLVPAAAFPPVPEEVTAYAFTADTAGADGQYRYSAHLVFVRAGRALLGFGFGSIGEPVPLDEQQRLATRVATRAVS